MRILSRLRRNEEGAILVWVALLMVVLLGMGAIAIDAGYAFAVKRETSTSADAAALAGAHAAAQKYIDNGCTGVEAEAESVARDMVDANNLPGEVTRDPDANCDNTHITVSVDAKAKIPTFLGSILGVDSMTPGSSATAEVVGSYGGLRPLSVCENDFPAGGLVEGVTYQTVYPQSSSSSGTCGGASGNFGFVEFPDGGGSTGDLIDWIENGYTGSEPITIPGPLDGNTGAVGNWIKDPLNGLINDTNDPSKDVIISLPSYKTWGPGSGGNAVVNTTGVISVKLCGYSLNGSTVVKKDTNNCWDQAKFDADTTHNPKLVFQWQYVKYVAPYVSSGTCPLDVCVPTVRLVK